MGKRQNKLILLKGILAACLLFNHLGGYATIVSAMLPDNSSAELELSSQDQHDNQENSLDNKWVLNNMCYYQYLPMYKGMLDDGINAVVPWEQSREFYENLGSNDRELLEAYGYETFNEFIPKVNDKISEWYPIYS